MNNGKSRAWCFTTFAAAVEPSSLDTYWELLKTEPTCRYLVAGRELCPTTGRPHIQGYVYFKDAKSLSSVRTVIKGNLIRSSDNPELKRPEQNRVYCTKAGDFHERGDLPMSQKEKGSMEMYIYLI